ncbi:MAG: hypothetical protein HY288_15935 [Planctomycetia bacterium]|nr:hypothetical protein [Planctomycetia bacterium]
MTNDKRNRVFWLGMHVVLTKTELPRLRALGYEVFNPPYLTDIYDQSAVTEWDRSQPTTLPAEVFEELSQYSFFYNRISPRIAELLNEYFGTVIVTISPTWLQSMLEAYQGRIIYRVYGQVGTLSDTLWSMRLFRPIQERENFYFVPHAEEAIRDEHAWLKARMTVVPYTIPLDVFEHAGTWSADEPHAAEIMACCPNIDNPHYAHHYHYLNTHFPEPYLKLYGVQPRRFVDPRVAGTLPREEQLRRYRRASGFWYHYDIPNCCYLPPIEMMAVGGPVVYMRGSLLARSFQSPGPGEVSSVEDAKRKIQLLLAEDRGFLNELGVAQRQIVRRYHPDYVHPIFDRTFRQLIQRSDVPRQEPAILHVGGSPSPRQRVYVFFHTPGQHVTFQDGVYKASDEIARTVGKAVCTLLEDTNHEVVVTCFADQLQCAFGYLGADKFPGRLRFLVLDPKRLAPDGLEALKAVVRDVRSQLLDGQKQMVQHVANSTQAAASLARTTSMRLFIARGLWRAGIGSLALVAKSRVLLGMLLITARAAIRSIRVARRARAWLGAQKSRARAWLGRRWRAIHSQDPWMSRCDCVNRVNAECGDIVVIVPHGCLFPEALLVSKPIVICLPDETPSVAAARCDGLRGRLHGIISRCLAEKAATIVASSEISRFHLFAARLPTDSCRRHAVPPGPTETKRVADPDLEPHADLAVGAGDKS